MSIDDVAGAADQGTALDPDTDPLVLAAIARHRPDLRALVAMNHATGPDLLRWLADLNDPVIDAALTARNSTRQAAPDPASTLPVATHADPAVTPVPGAAMRGKRRTRLLVSAAAAVLVLAGGGYLATQLLNNPRTAATEVGATITLGGNPVNVAVDEAAHTAYVTSYWNNDTVWVVDTTTNQVTTTIPVGDQPGGVAVDPTARTVYVTNLGDDTVSVIDTTTNQVTTTIPVGDQPVGVAVVESARAVYVTSRGGTVSMIDTTTNQVTFTIPVGAFPDGVAVDQTAQTAYVINYGDNNEEDIDDIEDTVSVIDTTTNQVTATIPVGNRPWGVAVDEAAHTAYVSNTDDGTVSVIDTTTNQVTATIPVGGSPWGIAVNPQTGTVYVTNQDAGTVSVLQAP